MHELTTKLRNGLRQQPTNFLSGRPQGWIPGPLHRSNGIDARHFDLPVRGLPYDHVAGEQHTELVLDLQGLMREARVASTQDAVLRHLSTELGFERRLHVD